MGKCSESLTSWFFLKRVGCDLSYCHPLEDFLDLSWHFLSAPFRRKTKHDAHCLKWLVLHSDVHQPWKTVYLQMLAKQDCQELRREQLTISLKSQQASKESLGKAQWLRFWIGVERSVIFSQAFKLHYLCIHPTSVFISPDFSYLKVRCLF